MGSKVVLKNSQYYQEYLIIKGLTTDELEDNIVCICIKK